MFDLLKTISPGREVQQAYWSQYSLLYLLLSDEQLREIAVVREMEPTDMLAWAQSMRKDLARNTRFFALLKENARDMLTNTSSGYATGALPLLIEVRTYMKWADRAKALVKEYLDGREIDLNGSDSFILDQLTQEGMPESWIPWMEDLLGGAEPFLKMKALCKQAEK